mmetsp:Transcript_60669/g.144294  ORF Transcript_60669/g.144294 Transcript_60669/m.144294 type:complete len:208 (-) Transcript_60669:366-989(-)
MRLFQIEGASRDAPPSLAGPSTFGEWIRQLWSVGQSSRGLVLLLLCQRLFDKGVEVAEGRVVDLVDVDLDLVRIFAVRLEDLVVAVVDDLHDRAQLLPGQLVHVVAQLALLLVGHGTVICEVRVHQPLPRHLGHVRGTPCALPSARLLESILVHDPLLALLPLLLELVGESLGHDVDVVRGRVVPHRVRERQHHVILELFGSVDLAC